MSFIVHLVNAVYTSVYGEHILIDALAERTFQFKKKTYFHWHLLPSKLFSLNIALTTKP